MMQDILAADAFSSALGVQCFWDQRQHGPEFWKLDGTGVPAPGCPAWSASDFCLQYASAYVDFPEPEIPDSLRAPAQELPVSWFLTPANWNTITSYPHITFTQNRRTFAVAGTWSEEIWPTPAGQSDREVRFYTLSDGGHQWPGAADNVGWNAQLGVMDFFDAH